MSQKNESLPIQGLDDHDAFLIAPQFSPNVRNVRSLRNRITRAPGGTLLAPVPIPGVNPGSGMAAGMFQMNTSAGNQTIAHGLGLVPQALILFTAGNTALSTAAGSWHYSMGMTDGTTSRSSSFASETGGPSQTAKRYAAAALTIVSTSATTLSECQWVSWNASNFVINWSGVDGNARYIGFWVLGHASLSAQLVEWTFGAATGNQSVAGVAFQPDLVMHLHSGVAAGGTSTDGTFGTGAMASTGMFAGAWATQNNQANHNTHSININNKAITMLNAAGSAVVYDASIVSLDVAGFTVNRTTAPAAGRLIASLCLKGFSNLAVGTFTTPSVTPPAPGSITSLSFTPTGLMHFTGNVTGSTTINTGLDTFIGVADGTVQVSAAVTDGSTNVNGGQMRTDAFFLDTDNPGQGVNGSGIDFLYTLRSFDSTGLTIQITYSAVSPTITNFFAVAFALPGTAGTVGVIRNFSQPYVGLTTAVEKMLMLTHKSAYIYTPSTSTTGVWTGTAETYTGTSIQRFSIANTQGLAVWSQGVNNIRQWDGTTFGPLVTTGTNHAARILLAFANRVVSIRPFYAGVDHPTQIRWCRNGIINDWGGAGSGSLEIIDTSQDPLITGFVLGDRAYLAKRRELIELIWTGTDSPVFGTQTRVRGMGILAPHSVGLAEQLAFWLGEDDIYMFDGSTMTAVGERVYHTITALIDYSDVNLDQIQAAVFTPDSQYWLVVPPYVFIYDYRRDIWDWDDVRNFQAISTFNVGTNFTGDIDRSQFVVLGDSSVQTIREDSSINTYLGAPIDSYFETKDYTAEELLQSYGFKVTLWDLNSLRELRFQSVPGYIVEIGASVDRGVTFQTQNVTVNAQGVGVAWFQLAFSQIRFRFRRYSTDGYEIHGQWGIDWETAGGQYP